MIERYNRLHIKYLNGSYDQVIIRDTTENSKNLIEAIGIATTLTFGNKIVMVREIKSIELFLDEKDTSNAATLL